jgi:hypothetical protein
LEFVEHDLLGPDRQALVDRQGSVPVVPYPSQGVDEIRTAGQVDCHQLRHGR